MQLKGKVALITGGSTGIGFATARRFLAEGAEVIITGQDHGRLSEAARKLGSGVLASPGDIGSLADIDMIAAEVRARFKRLDILFLNAGIAPRTMLHEITEAEFDRLFAVNVKGVLFPVQRLEPMLSDGASVIATTSINNRIAMPAAHLYSATKAAVRSLVRTLAHELSPRGIRVNAISPGPVDTPMAGKMAMTDEEVAEMVRTIMPRIPLRRGGGADELASVALFLASSASSYITGTEIMVDGGWTDVSG